MENKKLGTLLIIIGLVVGGITIYYTNLLSKQSQAIGCYSNPDCFAIEKGLSISHIAVGIFSFILALGFYLLFFNKTEKVILDKLEKEKNTKIEEGKFESFLKALNPYEQRVVSLIREQQGITQNHLQIKAEMSKAKLSYVLQDLEKRGIIKRVEKGRTLAVYLKV